MERDMKALWKVIAIAQRLEREALTADTLPVATRKLLREAAEELNDLASHMAAQWGTLAAVVKDMEK